MRVLVITADQFEDSELFEPAAALQRAGAIVDIASFEPGGITGKRGGEETANLAVAEVDSGDYDMLLLPGGKAPARLRESPEVLELARAFVADGKPVAAICHGPQILVSAGLVEGRTMTSYKSVGDELAAAGAHYVDRPVVTDDVFITSREPGDLPVFIEQLIEALRRRANAA
jgi:protease I